MAATLLAAVQGKLALTQNTRGYIAQMVYKYAEQLLGEDQANRADELRSLMVT